MNVSETRISDVFNLVKKISRFCRLFVALAVKAQFHVSLYQVFNGSNGFLPAGFDQESQEVAGEEVEE